MDCDECGKKVKHYILLQVCIPSHDEEGSHEKEHDIFMCYSCLRKMGTLGSWIISIGRRARGLGVV